MKTTITIYRIATGEIICHDVLGATSARDPFVRALVRWYSQDGKCAATAKRVPRVKPLYGGSTLLNSAVPARKV